MTKIVSTFLDKHKLAISLGLILLLGAFMRFYRLDSLPPGLHPDEAANGLDIFRMFDHHDFRPIYDTNGPREALFFYLQAIFVGLMGNTILALRMAPALIGTLAIGATYLWAREWFGNRTALIAAFILAITPWGITISRDGFRASMMMLMVPLTLWLYTKALRTKRLVWLVLAGVSLGAGFYTYLAFRLLPAALVAIIIFSLFARREMLRQWLKPLGISLIAMVIVLVPLGVFGFQHPEQVNARTGGVSVLNPDLNHGKPIQTLADSVIKTVLMFNIHGDENYRQNLGGQPEFNIFIGAMFILGILLALSRLASLRYFALLMVFGSMLLPAALTAEGLPHALRSIGALVPAVILAALGIGYMLDRWNGVFPVNSAARTVGTAAVVFLLALSAFHGYTQYFIAYAGDPKTFDAYANDSTSMGNFLNQSSFEGTRYVVAGEYQSKPIEYLTHYHSKYTRIDPEQLPGVLKNKPYAQFLVPENNKDKTVKVLRTANPDLKSSPHFATFNPDNELFSVYVIGQK